MKSIQYYSRTDFDRAPHLRENKDKNLSRRVVYFRKGEFLRGRNGDIFFPSVEEDCGFSDSVFLLGNENGCEVVCADLSQLDEEIQQRFTAQGTFFDLRDMVHELDRKDAATLAYAKGLAEWNAGNRFCGLCGQRTRSRERGHSRICTDTSCAKIIYPRIDPAVIVLIEYRPENGAPLCLLNRVKTGDEYRCSVFAGFVEVGESLENAVAREMKEEVNVDITDVAYAASQPWPFPSSVMIGFTAQVKTKAFQVDHKEIKDAAWYTAGEIEEQVAVGKMTLSRSDSIARSLIEDWVAHNKQVELFS